MVIQLCRLKQELIDVKKSFEKILLDNDSLKKKLCNEEYKIQWYKVFTELENDRFESRFKEILSKLFSPTQISLMLHPKAKVYKWTPEDISSAITLRSISPKAYRYLRLKKNFPLPG